MPNAQRVALALGAWAQHEVFDLGGGVPPRILPTGSGEVVVLHYNGLAPIKAW